MHDAPPLRRRRTRAGFLTVLCLAALLTSAAPPSDARATQPPPPTPLSPTPSATALPPLPTPAVGEPLITLRLTDRLYLHTPNPPDVLGIQIQVVSAIATTISLTATIEPPAVPAGNSGYPARLALQVTQDTDSVFLMPGGFTVPPDTPPDSQACVRLQWSMTGGPVHGMRGCATVVGVPGSTTATPTAGTPTPPPTAPCYLAALAALTRQGARYSQGGASPSDPIDPNSGEPYPRTGPTSFDCSGLVWWSYAQAGIPIGQTTLAQLNDGVALPCTLDDLRGTATRCWTLGDLIFLSYTGGRHVAIYVGQGLFVDCYNHQTGCVLHDVSRDSFYRAHFLEARRIVAGCEELTIDPGAPMPSPPIGEPENDLICTPDGPNWTEQGVGYSRGCGPPLVPPGVDGPQGTLLRQFTGIVGWLGDTGRLWPPGPAGVHLHLGLDAGVTTDVCRWPYQVQHTPPGEPPSGGDHCLTSWADPVQFLPQANGDTLLSTAGTPAPAAVGQAGDATYDSALMQLPPPGHPAGLLLPPAQPDQPGGTWWSPGNDDRARNARCPLGGPAADDWLTWIAALVLPWLFGC